VVLGTAGVAGVLAVILAVLAVTVLPPAFENLSATVVERDTTVGLPEDEETVSVDVPSGWQVSSPMFSRDTIVLRSPDRALELRISARDVPLDEALSAAARDDDPDARTEDLASGFAVAHIDADDVLLAAVGRADADASALVEARLPQGGDLTPYRATIAEILEGIEVRR
jgi:hypothetical protein